MDSREVTKEVVRLAGLTPKERYKEVEADVLKHLFTFLGSQESK